MSEYLIQCPKCNSVNLQIIKELNPKTMSMNMDVIAKCNKCEHEFQTQETSYYTQLSRNRGWLL